MSTYSPSALKRPSHFFTARLLAVNAASPAAMASATFFGSTCGIVIVASLRLAFARETRKTTTG